MNLDGGITKPWADVLRKLRPGQIEKVTLSGGGEFVIMHYADWEHVATLAGVRITDAAETGREKYIERGS